MEIIKVKVKPNKSKTKITKKEDDILCIDLKAKPENNEANIELIKFLKKHFKKEIKIISGLTNKNKTIKIT